MQGKYYEHIEKDPRLTASAPDEKIDLKSLGHFKRDFATQKTMLPDKDVRVKRASKGVDKYVEKML